MTGDPSFGSDLSYRTFQTSCLQSFALKGDLIGNLIHVATLSWQMFRMSAALLSQVSYYRVDSAQATPSNAIPGQVLAKWWETN